MGQYYRVFLGKENGKPLSKPLYADAFGSKLMEIAYRHSVLMDWLYSKLYGHSMRVIFGGDYSNDPDCYKNLREEYPDEGVYYPVYDDIWGKKKPIKIYGQKKKDYIMTCTPDDYFRQRYEKDIKTGGVRIYDDNVGFPLKGKFLVNHTTKETISLDRYFKECAVKRKDYYGMNMECTDPLPILTALGNGMGGGDYVGTNESYVGTWAWDLLSVEDEAPEGYLEDEEGCYNFIESVG